MESVANGGGSSPAAVACSSILKSQKRGGDSLRHVPHVRLECHDSWYPCAKSSEVVDLLVSLQISDGVSNSIEGCLYRANIFFLAHHKQNQFNKKFGAEEFETCQ